jgi:Flp pilus assembly protein TadG
MTPRLFSRDRRRPQAGFVLIILALCAFVLFGMLGVALDLGHVFIAKSETQTFTDSAAVSAALRLDGSSEGVRNAEAEVTNNSKPANRNAWNLSTALFPQATTVLRFGATKNGPWVDKVTAEAAPAGIGYARVLTTVTMPLYVLPVAVNATSMNVSSIATAGQVPAKPVAFPFTPMAHNAGDPVNFGLEVGQEYTFRWGAGFKGGCAGDLGADPLGAPGDQWADTARIRSGGPADIRGYWGDGGSAEVVRQEVVDDFPMAPPSIGYPVPLNGGDKNTIGDAVATRIGQDSVSGTVPVTDMEHPLSQYNGNGRRLVVMPVSDPHNNNIVLGYRAFLLLRANQYNGGGGSDYCAVYIGSYNEGSTTIAAYTGTFKTRLVQ